MSITNRLTFILLNVSSIFGQYNIINKYSFIYISKQEYDGSIYLEGICVSTFQQVFVALDVDRRPGHELLGQFRQVERLNPVKVVPEDDHLKVLRDSKNVFKSTSFHTEVTFTSVFQNNKILILLHFLSLLCAAMNFEKHYFDEWLVFEE